MKQPVGKLKLIEGTLEFKGDHDAACLRVTIEDSKGNRFKVAPAYFNATDMYAKSTKKRPYGTYHTPK